MNTKLPYVALERMLLVVFCMLLCALSGRSQSINDIGLRGLRHVPQNVLISPSWIPDSIYLGEYRATKGGQIGVDVRSNYLVIQDIFNSLNHNNDINVFRLLNKPPSTFSYTGIITTASLGYLAVTPISRKHNMYLNSSIAVKGEVVINMNELDTRVFSNATRVSINKNLARAMSWIDFAVGISGTFRSLSYGLRVKYLMGLAYYDDFWNINGNISEDTVSIFLGDSYYSFNFIGSDPYQGFSPIGHGVAFDFGLSLRASKKTYVGFSLLNVGFIGWNQPFSSKAIRKTSINLGPARSQSLSFASIERGLKDNVSDLTGLSPIFRDTTSNSIIPLYAQLGVEVKHIFNTKWHTGLVYHTYLAPAAFKYSLSAYLTYRFFRGWEFTINSGLREGGFSSLGIGISHTAPSGQFFITTENVVAFMDTYNSKNLHILVGFNFRVGNKSLKRVSPLDRLLCADPVIDESIDQNQLIKTREILSESIGARRKGHYKFNTKYPDGILQSGKRNKNRNMYRNSYSEIISQSGKEGEYFDKVDYIGEKLEKRRRPAYTPKIDPPKPSTDGELLKQGKDGKFHSEKHTISLPKRKAPKEKKKRRKHITTSADYGSKGTSKKSKIKSVRGLGEKGGTKRRKKNRAPSTYGKSGEKK